MKYRLGSLFELPPCFVRQPEKKHTKISLEWRGGLLFIKELMSETGLRS